MSGKYVVDTNIVIACLNGEQKVVEQLDSARAVYLPVIVLGELLFGANRSVKAQENRDKILEFCDRCKMLFVDELVAQQYADIRADLFSKGTPLPGNDIWIAAITMKTDAVLVSRDNHFQSISGLGVESW